MNEKISKFHLNLYSPHSEVLLKYLTVFKFYIFVNHNFNLMWQYAL